MSRSKLGSSAVHLWLIGLIATLTAFVAALACGGKSGSGSAHPLVWTDCGSGFGCATLDVPIDYDHSGGKKITLALTRLPASNPAQRIGVLLVNPGGPGKSGINLAHSAATAFPASARARFDIIGWDPRGVGQSSPVRCDDATESSMQPFTVTPAPRSPSDPEFQAAVAFGEACLRATGDELGFVDTTSSAKDMEQIRLALHEDTISYIGYSYGTFLGAQYADLYPSRVRAFVLDAAIDPTLTFETAVEGHAIAAQRALQAFLSDCAARPACPFYSNGDPRSHFEELHRTLAAEPITVRTNSGKRLQIDGGMFAGAVYQGLIQGAWEDLAQALADVELRRDGAAIARLVVGGAGTGEDAGGNHDAEIAINCLDTTRPDQDALDAVATRVAVEAPDFPAGEPRSPCDAWPFEPTWHPHELHASGSAPILVVGTTDDPVTPYEWAQSLARQLSAARLLTWQGHVHAVSYSKPSLSPCVDSAITAYLIDLVLPNDGAVCQ